jgi:AcrR family transcriptional regulator
MTATSPSPRERLVHSAAALIQQRGVSGVGLREVVVHADAARGSLQHYFPGGKTQLVSEALAHADLVGGKPIRTAVADQVGPGELLRRLCGWWRRLLSEHDYALGCPVVAVVADDATTNESLRAATATVFASWQAEVAGVLLRAGHSPDRARSLAALVVSAVEGAVVLSRSERSLAPLDAVEKELRPLLSPPRRRLEPPEQQPLF